MRLTSSLGLCGLVFWATTTLADDPKAGIAMELNRVDPVDQSCRLTFITENQLSADLETLSLEIVLIDTSGQVDRLTLFDFGALPAGTPRVRQFDLTDLSCASIGKVLINGVASCGPVADCASSLSFSTRTGVEVIG